ncbi:MAG: sodium:proton antiporter [Blautia sp.]|nr:sodium:proton antiporter [Blautia sp.]
MVVNGMLAFIVFFPFAAGTAAYFCGKRCNAAAILSVITEAAGVLYLAYLFGGQLTFMSMISAIPSEPWQQGFVFTVPEICGFGLHFQMDGFRLIYGGVAALMWLMTTIFSREYFKAHGNVNRFYLFLLWTLGATMGVFLSADLYTTFVFFEIMSFTSYVWVAQEENRPSLRAAATYLAVAVIGGLVMLMGIFLLYHCLGTVAIDDLSAAVAAFRDKRLLVIAGGCMLFGFGAKAGAFPLHIWLPKAHPVAPAPASALLSGILTKTGIYGVLILSGQLFLHDAAWGKLILAIGVVTMLGGAVLAVFSIDLKRTLACSSMSQIGFILVGIGMQGMLGQENELAVHGTVLHMVNHSLIKLVLFMAAGVIYMNTHLLDLNKIRGFGRRKPLLKLIFLTGALAIGGIPLFGGYISKTLLHEAIVEYGGGMVMKSVEWLFLISGGLTVAYMTKLYVAVFVEKNEDAGLQEQYDGKKKYMNGGSVFALGGSALILFLWGLVPGAAMDRAAVLAESFMHFFTAGSRALGMAQEVTYFSLGNLSGALISVVIGAVVYVFFIRKVLIRRNEKGTGEYVNPWPQWMDLEELLYRPLLLRALPAIFGVLCRVLDSLTDTLVVLLRKTFYHDSPLPHELSEGNALTFAVGKVMNGFQFVGNHIWRRNAPLQKDYIHIAALWNEEFRENNRIIQRSLSFGLLMFCVGLTLTMVYIIWF